MRLSTSRQEISACGAAKPSSGTTTSSALPQRRGHNVSPWSPASALRCRGRPFSRMCARMPNHSTAARAPAAAPPQPAQLIDIGINLAHDSYDADRDAVLERAHAAGVVQMIITGSTLASTQRALQFTHAYPGRLFATAGVHPHHAGELSAAQVAELA